jgi:hypothetical protein
MMDAPVFIAICQKDCLEGGRKEEMKNMHLLLRIQTLKQLQTDHLPYAGPQL